MNIEPNDDDLAPALRVLELLCEHPELATAPESPYAAVVQQVALLTRRLKSARKQERRRRDHELIQASRIRQQRHEKTDGRYSEDPDGDSDSDQLTPCIESTSAPAPHLTQQLARRRLCYICKRPYQTLHHFYDALCPACGDENLAKRRLSADLSGRFALVTGGRIKIGFQIALKLLRAGAHVVVTSRFPRDAARRFRRETDFEEWRTRLRIYAADFRFLPGISQLADDLRKAQSHLDMLINNAAQTVRRPPEYYQHLLEGERRPQAEQDSEPLIVRSACSEEAAVTGLRLSPSDQTDFSEVSVSALMSQVRLLPSDGQHDARSFPAGQFDGDGQQIDRRDENSWIMPLGAVAIPELLETHAVNSLAPFLLIQYLEPLLLASPHPDRYIVNVSAMEGQLNSYSKTGFHPHTNMAKAGLNMLSRTCADRYASQGVYMNSVDTGWVTNEFPFEKTNDMQREGFEPPLDEIDGASRVCDPILVGLTEKRFIYGKFLKDYRETAW